jgi:hypothetical protein
MQRNMAPFAAIGMIGVVAAFVVLARLPDNSALRGALTGTSPSSEAATDACAVSAVGLKCRCIVRDEAECEDMDGTFYARVDGGIDACLAICAATE